MTQEHPITPSSELVEKWYEAIGNSSTSWKQELTTQAARWGADMELESCCKLLELSDPNAREFLYAARRPKPQSLKEQALALISHDPENQPFLSEKGIAIIRRALEQLDD